MVGIRPGAAAVFAALMIGAPQAAAGQAVVELFTSQACAACPPADALLNELSEREDVVALSLHVDYWDYLGWSDRFALPGHTDRQRAYRARTGERAIYTPQIVVQGDRSMVGSDRSAVLAAIESALARPEGAEIELSLRGDRVVARISNSGPAPAEPCTIWLVTYENPPPVAITRGENAGREIAYRNVVTHWTRLGEWDGVGEVAFDAPRPMTGAGVAVLVQEGGYGPILAATRLEF